MKLFSHQEATAEFIKHHDRVMVTSDPGTGKTISTIAGFKRKGCKKALVLAPLSILRPSWLDDIRKFDPSLKAAIAHGKDRQKNIIKDNNIVISNHDAVKWLAKMDPSAFKDYDFLCIDEFTVFKNPNSQRSKACRVLASYFPNLVMLSGTPNSNLITDIWHPAYLLDQGERLGGSFYRFRMKVCRPVQVGPQPNMLRWENREGAEEMVADWLRDITVRFRLEDCIDIPPNTLRHLYVDLPKKIRMKYDELAYHSYLETQNGTINAIHAGARVKKLLQLLSGAVYDSEGNVVSLHNERYELVMQLVNERAHSVVAFNWKHERDALIKIAMKQGIPYGVIDGSVNQSTRAKVVTDFQEGKLRVVFAHPQSAGHGLTLTRGSATIWCSPTYNAEHFQQFNRRIYRAGQTKKTETICIAARDTQEIDVYEKLNGKLTRMDDLLALFHAFTQLKETS